MNDILAHRFEGGRLMVIIADRLSVLAAKGEVTERYYNPGELFREVHIVMTNDDRPDFDAVQRMVGGARLFIHNLPMPPRFMLRTLGWQNSLTASYVDGAVSLARSISPKLVRTHNNFIEGVIARRIKERLGVPYVMSLHGVWDVDGRGALPDRIRAYFRTKLEKASLRAADAVIAVYAPILRYARAYGARRVELIYNIVAGKHIARKSDYELSKPPRLLTINRQVTEKNPENIIRAIADIDCTYTLVGDGPLHEQLKTLADSLGCADRVHFIKAMPNEKLCSQLKDFDLLVSHCDYWGISKSMIEGGIAGLPIIINRHPKIPIEEFGGGWVVECENTPVAYREAILSLLSSEDKRRALGANSVAIAATRFNPDAMERRTVALYREVAALAAA